MAENLRDMIVSIGFDVPRSPLSGLNREMNQFTRNVTGASNSMRSFSRSNNAAIDESRAMQREVHRQTDFIRQLARTSGMAATHLADDWSSMSEEMRRSFIQNHNQLIQHRRDLMNVEHDMRRLGNQMGHYTGTTDDFMNEIHRMGKEHKRISDQMINNNMALRQGFIQTVATMSAMSGQSEKISANYQRMGGALYGVNRPLLAVTSGLERMARNGNAANLALRMLGPNASMKALMDQVALINQGVMRQQAVVVAAGVAWLAFTAILAHAATGPDPSKVREEQNELTKIYTDEWKKRVDEISRFVDIFEKVSVPKVKPSDVMKAMQSQLKAMQTWRSSLQSLTKKGVDEGLIKELQKAGPSAAYQIRAIDRMSKPELDKYVKTWREKMSLAKTQATDELSKLKKETDAKIKDLQNSLKPLGVAWEKFKSTWATALKPFVDLWGQLAAGFVKIGTKIGDFVNYLNSISPWITKLAGMFLYLVATFTLLLSPLAVGIGYFMGLKAAFSAAWKLIAPLVTGLGAMMGTVLLVSGVVLGLGVALYLLWTRSETFRNGVIKGWNAIKAAAISVFNFIKPYIMQAIGAITKFAGEKLAQLKEFWDQNGAMILQAVKNVWKPIQFIITNVAKAIWSVMKFVWPYVLVLIKSIWGSIKGVINGALDIIMGVMKVFGGLFTGNWSKMWEGVKQLFIGALQFIWNLMSLMVVGRLIRIVKTGVMGIITHFRYLWALGKDIFKKMWGDIVKFFAGGAKNAVSKVQGMWNQARTIYSLLRQFGEKTFRALWNTIRSLVSNIARDVRKGFTTMKDRATSLVDTLRSNVTKRFNSIVEAAKALPGKIGSGIKKMGFKALDGIKSFGKTIFSGFKKVVNGVISGINWAMDGIGLKDKTIDPWQPPEYAKGTKHHPGGLAILGDGGGPELYRTPKGQVGLSPGKDTLMNLPKGTEVLPYKKTMELLNYLPAYAKGAKGVGSDGNILEKAWAGTKNAAGAIKDKVLDVWSYISNPSALATKIFEKFGVSFPKIQGPFYDMGVGAVKLLKSKTSDFFKKKFKDLMPSFGGGNYTGSASAWRNQILRAAAQMNELVTPAEVNGIIAQIQRESTGNQKIVQSPLVRDINTINGNPAKGLLQYIPQTFAKYRLSGYGDIFNGYHQLLAFFNNKNWRRDLPYGRRGWGPTGARKYETGGIARYPQFATLAENGWKEYIIPTEPRMRKNAHNLLSQANQELGYTPESSVTNATASNNSRPNINFNPVINIDMGGSSANSTDVKKAVQEALNEQWERLISIYNIEVVR